MFNILKHHLIGIDDEEILIIDDGYPRRTPTPIHVVVLIGLLSLLYFSFGVSEYIQSQPSQREWQINEEVVHPFINTPNTIEH